MYTDDNFTFRQVGLPIDQDQNEAQKNAQNVGSIKLSDARTSDIFRKDYSPSYSSTPMKEGTFASWFSKYDASRPIVDAPRAKIPYEMGQCMAEWTNLTRTHPDLAGLKGQSNMRLIPMTEFKQRCSEGYMWTVLKGRVYNLSPFLEFHPGGEEMLLSKAVGKDCTSMFNKTHPWISEKNMIGKCRVGILDDGQKDGAATYYYQQEAGYYS